MSKTTRSNLMMSIDNRATGDHEVMILKTTSNNDVIILEINGQTNKIGVHPDDLLEALGKLQEFIKSRPPQPKIIQAIGTNQLSEGKQLTGFDVGFEDSEHG